ncbi:hypothetical protein [Chryseobacterium sp.]|uniref:hypothetical protein n=1 Tax=Chryseobacterium sp. TaxID=1871047 RepID=UPI0028994BCF|nr:hypothetical protein [Chryseobacterium sp.]
MSKFSDVSLIIPNNINYEKLWDKINTNPDLSKGDKSKLKDSTLLFLHYLYPSSNYMTYTKNNGFHKKIKSTDFNVITRNFLTRTVALLENTDYPVIESKSYKVGKYSKSYKLKNDFFLFCKAEKITMNSRVGDNYLKMMESVTGTDKTDSKLENNSQFQHLFPQLNSKIITIDSSVDLYIEQLEFFLDSKLKKKENKIYYQNLKKSIDDKILAIKRSVHQIKNGEFDPTLNNNNLRLYSTLTSCKKEIRQFLRINGKKINEIDISNSHLYIFSNILKPSFYTNKNKNSLIKIDKNIYNIIKSEFYKSKYYIKEQIKNKFKYKNKSYIPYMCGTFLNQKDVEQFNDLPFDNNLYQHLNNILFDGKKTREYIKRNVMSYLNLKKHRENNTFIRKMNEKFPNVGHVIELINGLDNSKGCLAILLQRFESTLLLDIGIKKLLKEHPNLNFFTIHDSVAVEEGMSETVKNILSAVISETTGKQIGLSIKEREDPFKTIENTALEMLNKSYKKVISKRRKEKFNKR